MTKKQWMGERPERCELCSRTLTQQFVDGRLKNGQWGLLCIGCHRAYGVGLGLGRGQRYDLRTLDKLEG